MKYTYKDKNVYAAKKVVATKLEDGKMLYKVRWCGYGKEDDTWEPYEHLSEALKKNFNQFDCQRNELCVGECDSFVYVYDVKETAKLRINQLTCTASFIDNKHNPKRRREFKVEKVSDGYVVTPGKHKKLYAHFRVYVDKSKMKSRIPFVIAQK